MHILTLGSFLTHLKSQGHTGLLTVGNSCHVLKVSLLRLSVLRFLPSHPFLGPVKSFLFPDILYPQILSSFPKQLGLFPALIRDISFSKGWLLHLSELTLLGWQLNTKNANIGAGEMAL